MCERATSARQALSAAKRDWPASVSPATTAAAAGLALAVRRVREAYDSYQHATAASRHRELVPDRFVDLMALVVCGAHPSVRTAYQAMREVWHGRTDVNDLRVAAYIVAIDRVAKTYRSKGL